MTGDPRHHRQEWKKEPLSWGPKNRLVDRRVSFWLVKGRRQPHRYTNSRQLSYVYLYYLRSGVNEDERPYICITDLEVDGWIWCSIVILTFGTRHLVLLSFSDLGILTPGGKVGTWLIEIWETYILSFFSKRNLSYNKISKDDGCRFGSGLYKLNSISSRLNSVLGSGHGERDGSWSPYDPIEVRDFLVDEFTTQDWVVACVGRKWWVVE